MRAQRLRMLAALRQLAGIAFWMATATLCSAAAADRPAPAAAALQYTFGVGGSVAASDAYSDERGFGFEPAAAGSASQRFSVKVAEGNYRVTVRLGDTHAAASTTIKAETRRLMVENLATPAGRFVTRSFVVNVRTPALPPPPPNAPGGTAVRLGQFDADSPAWDDRLTLEIIGANAHLAALSIEPADVPTVYLAGDSTVTDQRRGPGASWGQMLPRFFGADIAVANHAQSGETLKSFLTALRLDKILSTLRAGDWLLIQFGHNDQKEQWPQTYVEAGTTYCAYLSAYIAEVRRRGATPILVTPPERRNFDADGHITNTLGDYPDAVRSLARELSVPLIDLHAMSKTLYEALGPERTALAFNNDGRDHTHHSGYGAYELARLVVDGIRSADPRLAAHLAPDAGTLDPAHPDAVERVQSSIGESP